MKLYGIADNILKDLDQLSLVADYLGQISMIDDSLCLTDRHFQVAGGSI